MLRLLSLNCSYLKQTPYATSLLRNPLTLEEADYFLSRGSKTLLPHSRSILTFLRKLGSLLDAQESLIVLSEPSNIVLWIHICRFKPTSLSRAQHHNRSTFGAIISKPWSWQDQITLTKVQYSGCDLSRYFLGL